MKQGEINKYEVFVTKLCDGNLKQCKMNEQLTNEHIYSIIDQLVDTLEESTKKDKCHNDVKPGNVLYLKKMKKNGQFEIKTKLVGKSVGHLAGHHQISPTVDSLVTRMNTHLDCWLCIYWQKTMNCFM